MRQRAMSHMRSCKWPLLTPLIFFLLSAPASGQNLFRFQATSALFVLNNSSAMLTISYQCTPNFTAAANASFQQYAALIQRGYASSLSPYVQLQEGLLPAVPLSIVSAYADPAGPALVLELSSSVHEELTILKCESTGMNL